MGWNYLISITLEICLNFHHVKHKNFQFLTTMLSFCCFSILMTNFALNFLWDVQSTVRGLMWLNGLLNRVSSLNCESWKIKTKRRSQKIKVSQCYLCWKVLVYQFVISKMSASRICTRVYPLRVRRFVHWATAVRPIDFVLCSVFMSSWLRIIDNAFAFTTNLKKNIKDFNFWWGIMIYLHLIFF